MPGLLRTHICLAASSACAAAIASAAHGADGAPVGFWRTTNQCFLEVFVLTENGHAQTAYETGEQETNAAWTWDGTTLTITSPMFPKDMFTAHMANDHLEAAYVWHDMEKDLLNEQDCSFERVNARRLN